MEYVFNEFREIVHVLGLKKTKTPKESILQSREEVVMFLKMCSDADMSIDSRECMSSIDDHTQLYVSENLIPMSMIKKRSRLENLRLNDEVNSCK